MEAAERFVHLPRRPDTGRCMQSKIQNRWNTSERLYVTLKLSVWSLTMPPKDMNIIVFGCVVKGDF
ncbi:MAG: hypothetical protein ACFFEX_19065, partial [Candidatus Thorarchaeota archaeon]